MNEVAAACQPITSRSENENSRFTRYSPTERGKFPSAEPVCSVIAITTPAENHNRTICLAHCYDQVMVLNSQWSMLTDAFSQIALTHSLDFFCECHAPILLFCKT